MPLPMGGNKPEQIVNNTNLGSSCGKCMGPCHHHFGKKILWTVVGILAVYLIFYVGTLIRNNVRAYNFIGRADRMERSITVNGLGKVTGNNDIAMTTIGYSNTNKDVGTAQAENNKVMDQIKAELKKMGVADKDLESSYNIYPDYNYTQDKGQELKGYRVSNSLTIKIRDLKKISDILGLAGKYGATEINGLNFTIDDPENLKTQAKAKALDDARVKAQMLAQKLGFRLGGVMGYYENDMSAPDYYAPKYDMAMGMGGGAMPTAPASISSGSKDVTMGVSVIYEILQ
jgi:uncharacterized protein YggE